METRSEDSGALLARLRGMVARMSVGTDAESENTHHGCTDATVNMLGTMDVAVNNGFETQQAFLETADHATDAKHNAGTPETHVSSSPSGDRVDVPPAKSVEDVRLQTALNSVHGSLEASFVDLADDLRFTLENQFRTMFDGILQVIKQEVADQELKASTMLAKVVVNQEVVVAAQMRRVESELASAMRKCNQEFDKVAEVMGETVGRLEASQQELAEHSLPTRVRSLEVRRKEQTQIDTDIRSRVEALERKFSMMALGAAEAEAEAVIAKECGNSVATASPAQQTPGDSMSPPITRLGDGEHEAKIVTMKIVRAEVTSTSMTSDLTIMPSTLHHGIDSEGVSSPTSSMQSTSAWAALASSASRDSFGCGAAPPPSVRKPFASPRDSELAPPGQQRHAAAAGVPSPPSMPPPVPALLIPGAQNTSPRPPSVEPVRPPSSGLAQLPARTMVVSPHGYSTPVAGTGGRTPFAGPILAPAAHMSSALPLQPAPSSARVLARHPSAPVLRNGPTSNGLKEASLGGRNGPPSASIDSLAPRTPMRPSSTGRQVQSERQVARTNSGSRIGPWQPNARQDDRHPPWINASLTNGPLIPSSAPTSMQQSKTPMASPGRIAPPPPQMSSALLAGHGKPWL